VSEARVTVGNAEIVSLSDGRMRYQIRSFFPSVLHQAWEPFGDDVTPDGMFELNIGSYLIRSEGKTVLIDTGVGESGQGFPDGAFGGLLPDLGSKGFAPSEVDVVFMSHLHADHIGWNFRQGPGGALEPTFPNARYMAPKADWDTYTRRAGMKMFAHLQEQVMPLMDLGVLDLVEGECALTSEVTTLPTPGHTPGHMSLLVSSNGERAVIVGDAIHVPPQITEPDWSPRPDVDPIRSKETRHALVDQAEQDGALLAAGHFPSPGFGRVVRLKGRRYWQGL